MNILSSLEYKQIFTTYQLFSTSSNEDYYIAENCLKQYFPATSMEIGVEKQLKMLYSHLTRLD